ncbi:MAG: sugar transferase [Planctomycetota bacterium]
MIELIDNQRATEFAPMEALDAPPIPHPESPFVSRDFDAVPIRELARPPRWRRVVERALAGSMLVVASPLLGLLALFVRVTSAGGAIYRQTRSGLGGREFEILKFRSMRQDAEDGVGAVWSTGDDPRVTWIGRVMRKTHLDELPQLWNIFRGDMAFVGPRPERPCIIGKVGPHVPGYRQRLAVLPGVTGLAQVNLDPDQSLLCVKRKFELDLEYIHTQSLWLDFCLLATTLIKMGCVPKRWATRLFGVRRVPQVHEDSFREIELEVVTSKAITPSAPALKEMSLQASS